MPSGYSATPTPYAVICKGHPYDEANTGCGKVYLTKDEYMRQLNRPNDFWVCPQCGHTCNFDDSNLEEWEDHA